ncbi:MAG: 7-cyano-7-deazaguanine synthase [Thermoguttaceae bacterium]|jgi:7-cyano-7-deazaguanine synthase in queuosine biosynthesis
MSIAVVTFTDLAPNADLVLRPGKNLRTGEGQFQARFKHATSLEEDVLTLASAVFASDLAFKRGLREQFTRTIDLTVPVVNLAAFQGIRDELVYILFILSHDAWNIRFSQKPGSPEIPCTDDCNVPGKVLLFSGGLDSLAAAVRYAESEEAVQLVSHTTGNQTVATAQASLFKYLDRTYTGKLDRIAVRVGGVNRPQYPFLSDENREETQRTRSFLFLCLAALTARRRGIHDVVVIAENGQLAIHLPLTAARISAFSTHTAHPEFVARMGPMLTQLLGFRINIENPFLYMTKAEVIEALAKSHSEIIPVAVSCWKASRIAGGKNHCGFCIPCLVRRIALEYRGMTIDEYQRDILSEKVGKLDSDDDGKRNLMELAEFVCTFANSAPLAEMEVLYPELVSQYYDGTRAVDMYRRFAVEARSVFDNYRYIRKLVR